MGVRHPGCNCKSCKLVAASIINVIHENKNTAIVSGVAIDFIISLLWSFIVIDKWNRRKRLVSSLPPDSDDNFRMYPRVDFQSKIVMERVNENDGAIHDDPRYEEEMEFFLRMY